MTATIYVPGTEERDLKRLIHSLQAIGAYLSRGQLAFPATQDPSDDPNVLDDYQEGSFTFTITAATPGDLSVAHSNQTGYYIKIGRKVTVWFSVEAVLTHSTASGNLIFGGLPFTADALMGGPTLSMRGGVANFQGVTKAGYTVLIAAASPNTTNMVFSCSGSGVALSNLAVTDVPSGGSAIFRGMLAYVATA